MAGIEPATDGLRNRCSTTELHWHNGLRNRHFRLLVKDQRFSQMTLGHQELLAACMPQNGNRRVEKYLLKRKFENKKCAWTQAQVGDEPMVCPSLIPVVLPPPQPWW